MNKVRHKSRCLQFAIIASEPTAFPCWQARCITQLLDYEHTELVLIIIPEYTKDKPNKNFCRNFRNIFWTFFYKYLIHSKLKALIKMDLSEKLKNIAVKKINLYQLNQNKKNLFNDNDLKELKDKELDFILHFEGSVLKGNILNVAKYGVWAFHHGDPTHYRGVPTAFWETYDKKSTIGVILQCLDDTLNGGKILHMGQFFCSSFCFNGTYKLNLDRVLLGAVHFPKRVCQEIIHSDIKPTYPSYQQKEVIRKTPSNIEMIMYFLRLSSRIYSCLITHPKITLQNWKIGIIEKKIDSFIHESIYENSIQYIDLVNKSQFMADPFGVYHPEESKGLIYFESFNKKDMVGKISYVNWLNGKKFPGEDDILEIPGHISYPYIFSSNENLYCIPEACESNQVTLWKHSESNNTWIKEAILIPDFPGVDPTVFFNNGYWWLFCTNNDTGNNSHLYIWYSKALIGPWQQHELNPIKCDVTCSRSAGTPFIVDNIIYRPAQNCAESYGKSIVINRIKELSPTNFQEEFCHELKAPKGKKGMHTISKFGPSSVLIDVYSREIFSFGKLKKILYSIYCK